jgi:hypothetical protein
MDAGLGDDHAPTNKRKFDADPGHKALAALSAVTMQLNKKVKKDVMEKAKQYSGDNCTIGTREMIKAIKVFEENMHATVHITATENGWTVNGPEFPGRRDIHVNQFHVDWSAVAVALVPNGFLKQPHHQDEDWIVVNAHCFRGERPEIHGGRTSDEEDDDAIHTEFQLMSCIEWQFCKFTPLDDEPVDHYYNLRRLIFFFKTVYVKMNTDFELPDNACLYVWPGGEYEERVMRSNGPHEPWRQEMDPRFVVILHQIPPP